MKSKAELTKFDDAAAWYIRAQQECIVSSRIVSNSVVTGFVVAVLGTLVFVPQGERWSNLVALLGLPALWIYRRWQSRERLLVEANLRLRVGNLTVEDRAVFFSRVSEIERQRSAH